MSSGGAEVAHATRSTGLSPEQRALSFDLDFDLLGPLYEVELDAHIAGRECGATLSVHAFEHHHCGLVALASKEKRVGPIGAEVDFVRYGIKGLLVDVDRDVLGNAVERDLLLRRTAHGEQGGEKEQRNGRRESMDMAKHARSVAKVRSALDRCAAAEMCGRAALYRAHSQGEDTLSTEVRGRAALYRAHS